MRTMGDLVTFFNTNGILASAVSTNKDQLQIGDIVQTKNSDSAFLVYLGKNNNGNIMLEDLYSSFECSQQSFDLLFTGNAVLVNHTSQEITKINGDNINDNPIHDNTTKIGPMKTGFSANENAINSWTKDTRLKNIAKSIGGTSGSQLSRTKAIWTWMHGSNRHIFYHTHDNTKHTLDQTLNSGYGNCCEQSRIVVGLARAMGLSAKFVHIPGHVFTEVWIGNKWLGIDTCHSTGYNCTIPKSGTISNTLNF